MNIQIDVDDMIESLSSRVAADAVKIARLVGQVKALERALDAALQSAKTDDDVHVS